uniref:Uncharacterized protein n=1 Tax=Setaria viridis TaxID=4556 RepID=A0A4U6U1M1_SETVI|nr:hypothetical protein SEVIR_6G089550v2 [Setaria viridis]
MDGLTGSARQIQREGGNDRQLEREQCPPARPYIVDLQRQALAEELERVGAEKEGGKYPNLLRRGGACLPSRSPSLLRPR